MSLPKSENNRLSSDQRAAAILKKTEVAMITYLGIMEISICFVFLVLRICGLIRAEYASILGSVFFTSIGVYKTRQTKNSVYALFLYFPVLLVFIPLRILFSEGLYSASVGWLCVLPATFLAFYFRIISPLSLCLAVLWLVIFFFLHHFGYIERRDPHPFTLLVNLILQISSILGIMLFADFSRIRLRQKMLRVRADSAKNNLIATLNHEINNPLAIMSAKLQIAKKSEDWALALSAGKEIERIKETIKKIEKISDGDLSKSDYCDPDPKAQGTQIYNIK